MSKWAYTLVGFASLSGATGVIESAAAAHLVADPLLKTSADFLIVNAAAAIAISAVGLAGAERKTYLLIGATLLLTGSILFGGELSAHVFLGRHVPLVAPVGGGLVIFGWLMTAVAAFARLFERDRSR
jgi:uncharacterized membrane protein YgdD (TMEM256/DUF423 family)